MTLGRPLTLVKSVGELRHAVDGRLIARFAGQFRIAPGRPWVRSMVRTWSSPNRCATGPPGTLPARRQRRRPPPSPFFFFFFLSSVAAATVPIAVSALADRRGMPVASAARWLWTARRGRSRSAAASAAPSAPGFGTAPAARFATSRSGRAVCPANKTPSCRGARRAAAAPARRVPRYWSSLRA